MLEFDILTMLLVTIFVLFLTASLVLVASLQLRRDPCLLWVSVGCYLACFGLFSSALRFINVLELQIIWFGNVILILAHASVWNAMRKFSGKEIRWLLFYAGAMIWTVLCIFPGFMTTPAIRILVYTVLCILYIGAAFKELIKYWRKDFWTIMPLLVIMLMYMLTYAFRATYWQVEHQFWMFRNDSVLTMFASLLITIGLAFSTLTLVKGREEERYRDASLHDELTGLTNRRALFSQAGPILEAAQENDQEAALLMFDLDKFKSINDKYGHAVGDKVLCDFACVLHDSLREQDICARIGGEEFVAFLVNVDKYQVIDLADRINKNMDHKNERADFPVTASIGIALSEDVGFVLADLMIAADTALYVAKNDGRHCTRIWSAEMQPDLETLSPLIR